MAAAPGPNEDMRIDPLDAHSGERMMQNMMFLGNSRVVVSMAAGIAAGVLGLTSVTGFLFMVFWGCVLSAAFIAQAEFDVLKYFPSMLIVVQDSVMPSMTFVMFWTIAYDFFHVFG